MSDISVLDAIGTARSLRRFKSEPVADEVIARVLDAAIRAPSGSSAQNWIFIVVKDPAVKTQLGEIYRKASRVLTAEYTDHDAPPAHLGQRQFDKMRKSSGYLFDHMADAPVLLLAALTLKSIGSRFSLLDPAAEHARAWRTSGASIYPAVQNIILACRAYGLGTVLTTIHTFYESEVKELLALPADVHTYALMPVGYPLDSFGPVKRRPLNEVAFVDRFGNPWQS